MVQKEEGYPDKKTSELFKVILSLQTTKEAASFFRDLLTISEIKEFANRFQAAKLLYQGRPIAKVAQKLKMSTTTVSRVAHWLKRGMGGYQLVLDRLKKVVDKNLPIY